MPIERHFVDDAGLVVRARKEVGPPPHMNGSFPPNSVIVMNNAPCQSIKTEKVSRMRMSKRLTSDIKIGGVEERNEESIFY